MLSFQLQLSCILFTVLPVLTANAATETLSLPAFNPDPKHCLLFTVDGLDKDYITSETTPNLFALKDAGVQLPGAINVYPTATTPNMSSLYTGAFPLRTGVGGNLVFRKAEKRYQVGPRPRNVVTLNEAFQKSGYDTAAVQIYMMEKADNYIRVQHSKPHDVTTMALSMTTDATSVPALMAVLFETVDKVGHRYGPDTAEARAEVSTVDAEIAAIIRHYAELGVLQDTMVVITADHGMSATDNVIDLAAVNKALAGLGLKSEWLSRENRKAQDDVDLHLLMAGNIQGYFNRDFPFEEQQRLFDELRKIEGIGGILDSITLRRMNCHPSAGEFVVEPAPGWRFRGQRGTHGTNRESDGYLAFFGAGVKPGVSVGNARTVDIMPTILRAFNIEIPDTVDGRPLVEGLLGSRQ